MVWGREQRLKIGLGELIDAHHRTEEHPYRPAGESRVEVSPKRKQRSKNSIYRTFDLLQDSYIPSASKCYVSLFNCISKLIYTLSSFRWTGALELFPGARVTLLRSAR